MNKHNPKYTQPYASYLDFYEDVYADILIEKRSASRVGASMFKCNQGAGDCSDAPTPDLILGKHLGPPFTARANLGAGVYEGAHHTNDIFLIPPNTPTEIEVYQSVQFLVVAIPYSRLKAMLYDEQLVPDDGDFGALHYGCHRDAGASSLIDALWNEAVCDSPYGTLYADQIILQIVMRLFHIRGDTPPALFKGGLSLRVLKRIIDIMHADLSCQIGLEGLAAAVDMSPWHMARCFKYSTGMAPFEYLTYLRLDKAKLLLESTDLSIATVAGKVGYQSTQALSRVFRRHIKCNPRDYRKQVRV